MIAFSKYHGCGNDFIIVRETQITEHSYSELAQEICHRNLGIGADGLIIVKENPLGMIFYNSDGSKAPMCGNGIRCFSKYCCDENICEKDHYPVETLAGLMHINIVGKNPFLAEVNMGKPFFNPNMLGIHSNQEDFLKQKLQLKEREIEVSSCFMGTIHTVVWLENLDSIDLEGLGKEISNHPLYTEKTNVNMVQVIDKRTLRLQTYERGAGMTYACGTGACASLVIGALEGKCSKAIDVILPYGRLQIQQKENHEVFMTGPAEKIGQGYFENNRSEVRTND